jgi:hypothetical protein
MKKLTLTFCALFALFVVAPAFADGPERVSSKEKEVMQPAPPVCDFYRAHEWDLGIWAAWAFAADTGKYSLTPHVGSNEELTLDPFDNPAIGSFDEDPTTSFIGGGSFEQQLDNPNERINIGQVSKNELFARDDTWGGGVDIKYFWSRYFGIGVEGIGLAAKTNFAGGGLLTFTGRYPFGRFAPYITGGLGFIDGGATLYEFFNEKHVYSAGAVVDEREYFTQDPVYNHHVRGLGQIGAGLEFRVTCHIGLMADFSWNFVFGQEDHEDKFFTRTLQGTDYVYLGDVLVSATPVLNSAVELKPGHGSDHQDFGLVRFGVTFSY